ncbi:iron-containing alcohol dehydrogenase family protein [Bacillus sp. 1P06AnD]|uniref:iron-containing alcohol dehydrogenase family protein n=1 Tax=Bacillus sp. 1P06AnD TaxID=3132208 RepID=UPI0039A0D0E1
METISVHGAPSEYILQKGSLQLLEEKLKERGFEKVIIVHGRKSWHAARPYWPALRDTKSIDFTYGGECSFSEIDALSQLAAEHHVDAIIGVGGGKVLDLVKAASHVTHTPYILIPTLASNCSPWTPVAVIYDNAGVFSRFDVYPEAASLVLVEPLILLAAPLELLVAGIGDTLAKWYEADVQMASIADKSVPLQISHHVAALCKEQLLTHSEAAIEAVRSGQLNDSFIQITETVIMLAGMVGGFGDHYGRVAAAHAIHNGLTALDETHVALHGEKVAYGILVQLVLEDKWAEVKTLLPFYRRLSLPASLKEVGVTDLTSDKINQTAQKATIPGESIHILPGGPVGTERVARAIIDLEAFIGR